MSITITITDPHLLSLDERRRLAEYLNPSTVPIAPAAILPPTPPLYPTPPVPGSIVGTAPYGSQTGPAQTPILPPAPATGPNIDARGYPWDARIHAESRSRNNDGTWRYRRGVKDDVIEPVEAELRGVMGMAQTMLQEENSAITVSTVPQEGEPVAAVPPAPPASDVPLPPPAAPAAPATSSGEPSGSAAPATGDDFNHLANVATKALAAKTITQAQITAILGEIGQANGCVLPHLGALFTRKDLIPVAREKIQAAIAAGGGI